MTEKKPYSSYPYSNMTPDQLRDYRKNQTEYNRNTYRMFNIRFRKESDAENIKWIESQGVSFTTYVKKLVKEDMIKKGLEVD